VSNRSYPRIGSERTRDVKGLCDCCERRAEVVLVIQEDYMRGNDEVMKLCGIHASFARQGRWNTLSKDAAATKAARRAQQANPKGAKP
jgi:hypothetical protein